MCPPLTTPFKSKTKHKNNATLSGIQQLLDDSSLLGYGGQLVVTTIPKVPAVFTFKGSARRAGNIREMGAFMTTAKVTRLA
jgi:hypothetical protein